LIISVLYIDLPFVSFDCLDKFSSALTTPTKEYRENSPVGSGESIKSSDSISSEHRKKKSISQSTQHQQQNNQPINGSLNKLSPDISSDGAGNNDADSIVSFESQKSNTTASMPVLEDGLSDSENRSDDEQSSAVKPKVNGRHQSTQSDFLFDPNHSSLITSSHKRQFAKSINTNGQESQSKSFYIRPPPPSSNQPVASNHSTPPAQSNEPNRNQQKAPTDEPSAAPAGKSLDFTLSIR
jgi:hypothetical protein